MESSRDCTKCGATKPLTEFYANPSKKGGYEKRCKDCVRAKQRAYTAAHQEENRQRCHEWYQRNRPHVEAYRRRRYPLIRAEKLVKDRLYYRANRQRILGVVRRYSQTHREQIAAYARKTGPESRRRRAAWWRSYIARKRARKAGLTTHFTPAEWKELVERASHACLACGAQTDLTVDHIVPLSRGGTNDIGNVQPLCFGCNQQKHTKIIDYRPWTRLAT